MNKRIIILGAGISGLSANYYLQKHGVSPIIYEKNSTYGGLCGSFVVDDFIFDKFPHVSFTQDDHIRTVLEDNVPHNTFGAEGVNYYKSKWIKHPVLNNLSNLDINERINVIKGYVNRNDNISINNYDDWLRKHYGDYYTDNFPRLYTRKYWTLEPSKMETNWIGPRMYIPSLEEVLRGAMSINTLNVHYSGENRYPIKGGIVSFLNNLVENADIRYNKSVKHINIENKFIEFCDGDREYYDLIVSTIPLPDLCKMIESIPEDVLNSSNQLDYTSGIMISLGFNKKLDLPANAIYIYDEELLPARLHSPSGFSSETAPEGCSSLQAEVYFSKYKPLTKSVECIMDEVIEQLSMIGLFRKDDIIVKDVRVEKYANIIFRPTVYENREKIHDYLINNDIYYAGRFGDWDYLWMDQSFLSGENAAKLIIKNMDIK